MRKACISFFIVFHLTSIAVWASPWHTLWLTRWQAVILPYMLGFGIWQKWDMFSPDPRMVNCYVDAEVTLQDGHSVLHEFPRMEKLGLFGKYFQERSRKFYNDNVRLDSNPLLWPWVARYVERFHATDVGGPVKEVRLQRHWSEIRPQSGSQAGDRAPAGGVYQSFVFYRYPPVSPPVYPRTFDPGGGGK